MEARKQTKSREVHDKCIDMSKIKLDVVKEQINKKISEIFQIEKFVFNELQLEQFINPMKIHIHLTDFLNGPLVKQFICELWPILLTAEEAVAVIPNDSKEAKKGETLKKVIATKHQNGCEPTKSSSHSRSRKESNMMNGVKTSLVSPKTFSTTLKAQGPINIEKDVKLTEKDIKHREKQYESGSPSQSTISRDSDTEISTKVEQKQAADLPIAFICAIKTKQRISRVKGGKQPLVPNKTFSSSLKPKKQQPDKENNKNSLNTEHQVPIRNKTGLNKQAHDKERKHSSRSSSHKKSSSNIVSESSEHGSDDGSACCLNGFANNCIFSPKKVQQETKAISQDQHRSTLFPEFLSETDDFLNLWNEGPDKETILLSEKFVYPDAKNTGKQMNNTVSPPPSSNQKLKKPNIDFNEAIKAEEEIKRARELHSRKRTHSTMLNESKKSKNDQTEPKKSSSKCSSDKGSSRKQEVRSSKQKSEETCT